MHDNPVRFPTASGPGREVSYETIPGIQGAVAAEVFEKLTAFIPAEHLSFGGGTVLATLRTRSGPKGLRRGGPER